MQAATTTLFVGLGPRGREVTREALTEYFGRYGAVGAVRCVGTRAFVEVASEAAARELIAKCDGQALPVSGGSIRLVVKVDEPRAAREDGDGAARRGGFRSGGGVRGGRGGFGGGPVHGGDGSGRTTLFVGLGPRGGDVTEEELRDVVGAYATVCGVRHRGGTAFVDVAGGSEAAAAAIAGLHGTTLANGVRLSVRLDGGRPRA